jgi:hypothetical protein
MDAIKADFASLLRRFKFLQKKILQKQSQSSHKTENSVTVLSSIFFAKTSTFVYQQLKTLSKMFSKPNFNQQSSQGEPDRRRRPQLSFLEPSNPNWNVANVLAILDEVLVLLEDISTTEGLPRTSTSSPRE